MKDFYDYIAKNYGTKQYDQELSYLDDIDSPKLTGEIAKVKNKCVLEVGSGTGRVAKRILNNNPLHLCCVEPSIESRKILANLFSDAEIVSSLNEVKDSFTYIFVVQTLIHINDKENFIRQLATLLSPRGKLVLSILTQDKPSYVEVDGQKVYQKIYPNKIDDIKNFATKANLKIIDEDTVSVDYNQTKLFGPENLGKVLSWYVVAEKQ